MGSESRREREKEEMKELILGAAGDIVAEDGFDKLSIRKIAARIEYSPAIIYHYFGDKEEIIQQLLKSGYQKVMTAVATAVRGEGEALERLKSSMEQYILTALEMKEAFIAVHMNSSSWIQAHTSSLQKGAAGSNAALGVLYQCVREVNLGAGIAIEEEDAETLERTTQLIVVSAIGFVLKLIVEKDTDPDQKRKLIEYYCNDMVPRMAIIK